MDEATFFSESLAAVSINDKLGYVDKSGKVAIEPQFSQADAFTGGIARVMLLNSKLAYIDESGRFIWRER
jgi:hypothetical protein